MDGQYVTWKIWKLVKEDRKNQDPSWPDMLELTSSGFHVVIGAFHRGQDSTN